MRIVVEAANRDEVFTDMVRMPERVRNGIENGSVVRIVNNERRAYAIVRGLQGREADAVILMDEFIRRRLKVSVGSELDSAHVTRATWLGSAIWYLHATNPAVRVPAWIAVWSLVLGLFGIFLGVVSLFR